MSTIESSDLSRLMALHRGVDGQVSGKVSALGERLVCHQGCSSCCADSLTVLEIEAELIRQQYPELLASGQPGPRGGCAFLDDQGSCRIYPHRPYVCRTQGLPLRWFEDLEDGPENRDICPLNLEAMAGFSETLTDLPVDDCWTIGPWEGRLASLQAEASGRFELVRVSLRSLFNTAS